VRRLLVAGLAALLVSAAPARADVYDDHPAAASRGVGDIVLLARGADGAIYERHIVGGAWTAWSSIGGLASSGPAAAAYGGAIHVFIVGTDLAVYENALRDGQWSGWASLGGIATSAPAAISRLGTNYLDLAVRGADNAIHLRTFQPGSGWSNWASLGGNLTSAPALNSQDPTVLNVWARGADGQLFQRAWTGVAWREWEPLGGFLTGAPAVLSRQHNMVDVFVRGSDRSVYQKHWQGGQGWGAWFHLDGRPMDSTPSAVSDTPGHVVLFSRSGGEIMYKDWREGVGWTAWTSFGPVAPPPPPPPPPPPAPLPNGLAKLRIGLRCTPPGGRLRVSLSIRKRPGMAKPRVRKVVFFVKRGPRRTDRRKPYVRRLRINRPAGSTGRVYARAFYTRKGSKKLRRKTVSRRFVMCR
jgi:hypothetical protein